MEIESLPELNGRYFLTPQEHRFIGSTVNKGYYSKPYSPLAVQEGWDITVVDYIRQKTRVFYTLAGNWLTMHNTPYQSEYYLETLLAPLDKFGNTVFDPRPNEDELRLNPDRLERLFLRFN